MQGIVLLPPVPPQLASDAYAAVTGTAMTSDQWTYYVTLAWGLVLFWLAWNLLRHRTGRAMRAIRDGEVAAAASGINLAGYKTLAFAISAFYAGIAGSLFGLAAGFVSPDSFPVALSIQLLVGAVVGGLASIPGPLIGGIFAYFLPIESNQWVPDADVDPRPDRLDHREGRAGGDVRGGVDPDHDLRPQRHRGPGRGRLRSASPAPERGPGS